MNAVVVDRPDVYEVTIEDKVVELTNRLIKSDLVDMLSYLVGQGVKKIELHKQVDMNIFVMMAIDLERDGLYAMEDIVCRHLLT